MLFLLYDLQHIRRGQWGTDIINSTSNIKPQFITVKSKFRSIKGPIIFSIISTNPLKWVGHYEPHLTDAEKTEAQGGHKQLTEAYSYGLGRGRFVLSNPELRCLLGRVIPFQGLLRG